LLITNPSASSFGKGYAGRTSVVSVEPSGGHQIKLEEGQELRTPTSDGNLAYFPVVFLDTKITF